MAELYYTDRQMNRLISRMPGVRAEVFDQGLEVYMRAAAKLAAHREEYQAQLIIGQGRTDTEVTLIDPAALSIEFGHYAGPRRLGDARTWVPGLHLFRGYRFIDGET